MGCQDEVMLGVITDHLSSVTKQVEEILALYFDSKNHYFAEVLVDNRRDPPLFHRMW